MKNKTNIIKFPGGESGVIIKDCTDVDKILIVQDFKDNNSIMELLLTVNAIRNENPNADLMLYMPYLPYGRDDRVFSKGSSFGLKVFADLINNLNFSRVFTLDIHSGVSRMVNNLYVFEQHFIYDILEKSVNELYPEIFEKGDMSIVTPDMGASKKCELLFKEKNYFDEIIYSTKKRDPNTGRILDLELLGDTQNKNVVVVDDICDGGATFIRLGERLANAKQRLLFVSHGIFSKGFDELSKCYDLICSTNSHLRYETGFKKNTNEYCTQGDCKIVFVDVYSRSFIFDVLSSLWPTVNKNEIELIYNFELKT